ncbi:hypothetical protein FJZ26_06120 [Candidatus Parvarchaeota archaeon]|nr:hypothetical protein [Candidatus Parvarchaeota archaeon]
MGCCVGKKFLKIIFGAIFILVSMGVLPKYDPWLILGAFLLIAGASPFLCQCEACTSCSMGGKKK